MRSVNKGFVGQLLIENRGCPPIKWDADISVREHAVFLKRTLEPKIYHLII